MADGGCGEGIGIGIGIGGRDGSIEWKGGSPRVLCYSVLPHTYTRTPARIMHAEVPDDERQERRRTESGERNRRSEACARHATCGLGSAVVGRDRVGPRNQERERREVGRTGGELPARKRGASDEKQMGSGGKNE